MSVYLIYYVLLPRWIIMLTCMTMVAYCLLMGYKRRFTNEANLWRILFHIWLAASVALYTIKEVYSICA